MMLMYNAIASSTNTTLNPPQEFDYRDIALDAKQSIVSGKRIAGPEFLALREPKDQCVIAPPKL